MSATVHQLPVADPTGIEAAAARIAELERELKAREHRIRDLEDEVEGYAKTVKKQSREIGVLTRKVQEEADPTSHPQGSEIVALIERWMQATGHTKSKVSADRVKIVKAALRDGYTIEQLQLAVDGIGANPFVVNGQRVPDGNHSQRHDRLGIALGGGEKIEEFARLGHRARKEGLVTWKEEDA